MPGTGGVPPVLVYYGVFVPHAVPLELFLRAQGIPYELVGDRELEEPAVLRGRRLFIFGAGHCFERVPEWALGRGPATARLQEAISRGVSYLGICAGCFAAISTPSWPIDLDLGLCKAKHRWPSETGAGVQFFTFRVERSLAKKAGLADGRARIWYHNGPIYVRPKRPEFRTLASFEPTPEERAAARGTFVEGKRLRGAPAIIECRYGAGRVVLCSPHPEFGDLSVREYQALLREWLGAHELPSTDGDPLAPGTPGHEAFLAELGGRHMEAVRGSANWRLLRAIVDDLLGRSASSG
jgi:hypothetical protein